MTRSSTLVIAASLVMCAGAAVAQQPRPAASAPAPRPPAAEQPPGPEPESTTATFSDWTLRCQRIVSASTNLKVCEVSHAVPGQQAQTTLLQAAFAKLTPTEPLKLTLVAPVSVTFPSKPVVRIGERDAQPVDLEWRRCIPGGCIAELEVRDDLLARWRGHSGPGSITLKDAAGRDVAIPISFRGLAQALDALGRI
jgi:invasion protein IalB